MNKRFLLLSLGLFCGAATFAQVKRHCTTHEKYLERVAQNPQILQQRELLENLCQQNEQNMKLNKSASSVPFVTIPVVIHVLYNGSTQNISNAQINSQLTVLNDDFGRTNADAVNTPSAFQSIAANTDIQFCLATVDPSGNPTTGIERKSVSVSQIGNGNAYYSNAAGGLNIWDRNKYLNIWVCDIDGGSTLGFAYLPGTTGASDDGVVIDYRFFGTMGTVSSPYDLGRTASHEVGHWLNLEHIWADESACAADDGVNDTPKQKAENYGCPSYPQTTQSGGRCSTTDPSSMFMNYMDYSDDVCMNLFTAGQKTRMQTAISSQRSGLLTSNGCSGTTGLSNSIAQLPVSVFPNPSNGKFEINTGNSNEELDVVIADMTGRTVFVKHMAASEEKVIDITHLQAGVYFAEFKADGRKTTKRLVKE